MSLELLVVERGPWFHLHNRMTLQLLWKAWRREMASRNKSIYLWISWGFSSSCLLLSCDLTTTWLFWNSWHNLWFFHSQRSEGYWSRDHLFQKQILKLSPWSLVFFHTLSIIQNIWHTNSVLTFWKVYFCFLRSLSRLNHNIFQVIF